MIDSRELYLQCKNFTVLLVEDYSPLREKIAFILEDFFFSVTVASDGEEGLDKYIAFEKEHKKTIDIVISDISMPHKDGLELSKNILTINPNQIIIIISAYQEAKYLIEFIEIGISKFMPKPIVPEQILKMMNKFSRQLLNSANKTIINPNNISLGKELIWRKKEKALFFNDKAITMSKYEYLVMQLLVSKIESICTMEEIIIYYYENEIEIDAANVRNIIGRLRKKLPEDTITSVYALGYIISL